MLHQLPENNPRVSPRSTAFNRGKFGRLFPGLPIQQPEEEPDVFALNKIAGSMLRLSTVPSESKLPAGYTYFCQFIGHDMSFDPTTIGERMTDPEFLWNFRTPALDLDSIYGGGPRISPYLYDKSFKFIVNYGEQKDGINDINTIDFQRNRDEVAIISDARNDENVIIARIHLSFQLLHNYFIEKFSEEPELTSPLEIFDRAKRETTWHYQWLIIYDYLPRIIGPKILGELLNPDKIFSLGRKYYDWQNEPFIPIEFSTALFRFGHSQVKDFYKIGRNKVGQFVSSSDTSSRVDLRAKTKFPIYLDLSLFFFKNEKDTSGKNFAHKIEPKISESLGDIPMFTELKDSIFDEKMNFIHLLSDAVLSTSFKRLANRQVNRREIFDMWKQILEIALNETEENLLRNIDRKKENKVLSQPKPPSQSKTLAKTLMTDKRFESAREELLAIIKEFAPNTNNLAFRTLLKGTKFSLPSGQSVARLMKIPPQDVSFEVKFKEGTDKHKEVTQAIKKYEKNTPLWYYILHESPREAEELVYQARLGEVGATLIGEVIIGILEGDEQSYLAQDPSWKPDCEQLQSLKDQRTFKEILEMEEKSNFSMADLLGMLK